MLNYEELILNPAFAGGGADAPADTAVVLAHFNPAGFRRPELNLVACLEGLAAVGAEVFLGVGEFPGAGQAQPGRRYNAGGMERIFVWDAPDRLWLKEALWNSVEPFLPERFKKVILLDADIVFRVPAVEGDLNWLAGCAEILETADVIQCFDRACWLDPTGKIVTGIKPSVASAHLGRDRRRTQWRHFHPGFAWGMRRDLFRAADGMYNNLTGHGDSILALAAMGEWNRRLPQLAVFNDAVWEDLSRWAMPFRDCVLGVGPYVCSHLWHGKAVHRKYGTKQEMVRLLDPVKDLTLTQEGIPCWTAAAKADPEKAEMIAQLAGYFAERREDEDGLTGVEG